MTKSLPIKYCRQLEEIELNSEKIEDKLWGELPEECRGTKIRKVFVLRVMGKERIHEQGGTLSVIDDAKSFLNEAASYRDACGKLELPNAHGYICVLGNRSGNENLPQCDTCDGNGWVCEKPAYKGTGSCKPDNAKHIAKWHRPCSDVKGSHLPKWQKNKTTYRKFQELLSGKETNIHGIATPCQYCKLEKCEELKCNICGFKRCKVQIEHTKPCSTCDIRCASTNEVAQDVELPSCTTCETCLGSGKVYDGRDHVDEKSGAKCNGFEGHTLQEEGIARRRMTYTPEVQDPITSYSTRRLAENTFAPFADLVRDIEEEGFKFRYI